MARNNGRMGQAQRAHRCSERDGPASLAHPTICSFGIEYFGATANEQGIRIFEITRTVLGMAQFRIDQGMTRAENSKVEVETFFWLLSWFVLKD